MSESLVKIQNENGCDSYIYLGLYNGKKVYRFFNKEIEIKYSDGEFIGFPLVYIEKGSDYERLKGKDLLNVMKMYIKNKSVKK